MITRLVKRCIATFDPCKAGTSEDSWLAALAPCPTWTPRDGPLIVVSPHPAEEVLAAGGLIHMCAAAGRPVTVVSVTDGEGAFPQWKGLDLVRRDELQEALRKLCVTHVAVVRIGLPDGNVSRYPNRLRNVLLTLTDPSATLIAPFENDGHPDHDAVGEVCVELARSQGIDIVRYPLWTWHHTEPATLDGAAWVKVALSAEARRAKARAVQCFESQLQPSGYPPRLPPPVLAHFDRPYEAFLA